ncbi:MAG: class I SAM-dependent methyltransferase [Myxococcales bacterium]|nr:class I SAM-dependent methyltransferase [Myxococcales bacterium]MCB9642027.1 class I SAM-dependent methyltransferase [Myxococcales bacterium]
MSERQWIEEAIEHALQYNPSPSAQKALQRPDLAEQQERYLKVLQQWNRKIRLTGKDDIPSLSRRHLADSLVAVGLFADLEVTQRSLDIGAGAGFPALPLSITFPKHPWIALETHQRRAAFLQQVRHQCKLPALDVRALRFIGEPQKEALPVPFARITFRAVAPAELLPHLHHYLEKDGEIIYWGVPAQAPEIPETLRLVGSLDYTLLSGEHFTLYRIGLA